MPPNHDALNFGLTTASAFIVNKYNKILSILLQYCTSTTFLSSLIVNFIDNNLLYTTSYKEQKWFY